MLSLIIAVSLLKCCSLHSRLNIYYRMTALQLIFKIYCYYQCIQIPSLNSILTFLEFWNYQWVSLEGNYYVSPRKSIGGSLNYLALIEPNKIHRHLRVFWYIQEEFKVNSSCILRKEELVVDNVAIS